MEKLIRRWRCTCCGTEGEFSYLTEDFAELILAAQRKGHLQRKPDCAGGRFEARP